MARGNTLWEIADRHYGDGMKWWAVFGANAKAIEKTARDHGRKGSDIGHWIFPETELVIPAPAAVKAGEKAVRATLEHVLAQHPQLLGNALCPEAQAPEDMGECFLGLLDQVPLLLDRVPLLLDRLPLLLDQVPLLLDQLPLLLDRLPLLLDQVPLLLDRLPLLLDRIDVLEEVSSDELLELVEPLITCVTEEEDPAACLTEAIANPPAQE
ncbi:LysM peptidoglycan-binding domain-containing protein [Streptomyces sp. NPDC012403]|uniref:LysM peptidoglycan-binding domain-containing protein n=1 Tax=Streptomyces sp. NPDC012403 TaxID=3364831 RepID=UPI0036E8A164